MTFDNQNDTLGFGDTHSEHGLIGNGNHSTHYEVFHLDFDSVKIPFIITTWIIFSSLAKVGFHMVPQLSKRVPESCLLTILGIIVGIVIFFINKGQAPPSTLTPNIFFLFMLPPIVLEAGYCMPNSLFFNNLGTILLMAIFGTIFNAMTIGFALYGFGLTGIFGDDPPGLLDTLLFSSLISAVDPVAVIAIFEEIHVDEVLYIVVFGESLLNDAVTVVLYNMFDKYVEIGEDNIVLDDIGKGVASFFVVALGGTIIGVIWGYILAFVTRFTHHATILEPLFVITLAYASYLNAEMFHLSGILAITFFGITTRSYVDNNISPHSQTTLKYAMKMMSSSSETIIFMFLGFATIHDRHSFNWPYIVLTIVFCLVFRTIGVLIQSALANRYRLHKLDWVDQFVLSYGGLRGAVAFALALLINEDRQHSQMFVTTTIAVIYWTVFIQGITIKPLVKFLHVKTSSEIDPTLADKIYDKMIDHSVAAMEEILGEMGAHRIRDLCRHFDDSYIKPIVLNQKKAGEPQFMQTLEAMNNKEAKNFIKQHPKLFAGLVQSKVCDDLETLSAKKIHKLLSKNLIPKNNMRRLSFESRHSVVDRSLEHQQQMMKLTNRKDRNLRPATTIGLRISKIAEVDSESSLNQKGFDRSEAKSVPILSRGAPAPVAPTTNEFDDMEEGILNDDDVIIDAPLDQKRVSGHTNFAYEHGEQNGGSLDPFDQFRVRPRTSTRSQADTLTISDISDSESIDIPVKNE